MGWDNPQNLWITRWTTVIAAPQTHMEWGLQTNCRFFHQLKKTFFFIDLKIVKRLGLGFVEHCASSLSGKKCCVQPPRKMAVTCTIFVPGGETQAK